MEVNWESSAVANWGYHEYLKGFDNGLDSAIKLLESAIAESEGMAGVVLPTQLKKIASELETKKKR